MRRGVGKWRPLWLLEAGWGWCDRHRVCRPDQYFALLVNGEALGVDEFGLEVFEVLIVEPKAAFERPIGHASLALQQVEDLGQDFVKRHTCSSTRYWPLSLRTCTRRSLRRTASMAESAYRVNDKADGWDACQRR